MRRLCCLLFFSIFLLSCHSANKPSLEKLWFYKEHLSEEEQTENKDRYRSTMEYGFAAGSFLDLQPNGKFTSLFSAVDYGTWELMDSVLVLTDHNNAQLLLEVKNLDEDQMVCINTKNRKVYRFSGWPNKFSSDAENPFSFSNNRWRVKAIHKESDKEIQLRLKNHFRHWEKYFLWGRDNNIKELEIDNTPSMLDMYTNGFTLQYYDYQGASWKNIFYDTTDRWRAYEMVYYLMYKKDIQWPDTKNRFERFISAFQQLQQWMDIDPQTYLENQDSTKMKPSLKKEK